MVIPQVAQRIAGYLEQEGMRMMLLPERRGRDGMGMLS
jgi:hypothetical protein